MEAARWELAAAFLDDLRRIDAQLLDAKKKLTVAVRASGTTLTSIFGVGPVVAATVIGDVRDVARFPGPTTSRPATGPHRPRCPRAAARSTGYPGGGTGG